MDTGLYRIELTALAGLVRIAGIGGGFSGDPEKTAPEQARTFRAGSLWFPAALVIGFGAWILLSGYSSKPAEGETASPATAVTNITLDGSMLNPPATPEQVTAAAEMAPVNWAYGFIAILAKGRIGIESPGHVHAPQRQRLSGQGHRDFLRLCPPGRQPFDRPNPYDPGYGQEQGPKDLRPAACRLRQR